MGGKLFNLPRMPREEYLIRERAVRDCLDRKLGGTYRIPRYYGGKADFGDMDVIVPDGPGWLQMRVEITASLGITRTKTAGRVFSTVFDGLQTGFFAVEERLVDSTYNYMSFNDLGNLLGRICRRFNLKYGEEGLSYTYRRAGNDHYRADLPVTQDFARICAFLKLDHAAWIEGFATLTALYEWVIASRYFSVAPYLDDLTGTMARRSRDRPTIGSFIDFLRERGIAARPAFDERTAYLPMVIAAFPEAGLEARIAAERDSEQRANAIAAKFNGKLVMRLRPELSGQALGEFIVAFKRSIPGFEAFLLDTADEEIARRIREFQAGA
jgi:hypothetical protein